MVKGKIIFLFFTSLFFITKDIYLGNLYRLDWSPSGNYLATATYSAAAGENNINVYSFDKFTNSLTLTDSRDYQNVDVWNVAWRPDGDYLAACGDSNGIYIYGFNNSSGKFTQGSPVATGSYGTAAWSVAWTSTGAYLAVGGSGPSGDFGNNELGVYRFDNGTSLTVTDSRNVDSDTVRSLAWSSDDSYLFLGGQIAASNLGDIIVYKFDSSSGDFVAGSPADYKEGGSLVRSVSLHPKDSYFAAGWADVLTGREIEIYSWDGLLSHVPVDSRNYGTKVYCLRFSPDGNYLAVGGEAPDSGDELEIYSFDSRMGLLSDYPVESFDLYGNKVLYGIAWSSDGRYLAIGGQDEILTTSFSYHKGLGLTRYDGTEYGVYKDVHHVLHDGDNAKGSVVFEQGFTITASAGARLDIKLPVSGVIDLRNTGTLDLAGNLILDSSITLSSGGVIWGGGNSIFLNGNLYIPDNSSIEFIDDTIIDGQGHDLILGSQAGLLIDSNVTLTLKNLTLKNTEHLIGQPIRCLDWYGKLCLENVVISLNDDFLFIKGQLFIHNDVEFTGESKFSYRSVRPSYIVENSNLLFSKQTTFEYYPSTTDQSLMKMQNKTSKFFFDGATLQTTGTGIRLTKGSLYFDNKVTLNSKIGTVPFLGNQVIQNYGNAVYSSKWNPNDRYLAVGGSGVGEEIRIYSFDGSSFTLVDSKSYEKYTVSFAQVNDVDWSPNGRHLAVGGYFQNSYAEFQVYSFDGTDLSFTTSVVQGRNYSIYSLAWRPDGKYIAIGGSMVSKDLKIYSFRDSFLELVDTKNYGNYIKGLAWSPDGDYLAVGGFLPTSGNELQIYSFDGASLSLIISLDLNPVAAYINSISWSPDGKYIVLGGKSFSSGDEIEVYYFTGTSIFKVDGTSYGTSGIAEVLSVYWSPDGRSIVVGGKSPASGNELQVYSFNNLGLSLVDSKNYGTNLYSVDWDSGGSYVALGGAGPAGGHDEIEVYPVSYRSDTYLQSYSNSIVFGNSSLGSDYDLDVYLLSAGRMEIWGKLWHDSLNSFDFANKNSYITLNTDNSGFKVTNVDSVSGWKETAIVRALPENTLFLSDNQEWGSSSGTNLPPQETFELINDFKISDNQTIYITKDMVIDGGGHDLILGHRSHFLVDAGLTVTLKNLKLKNSSLDSISPYPLEVKGENSNISLDNVIFALNGNFTFSKGKLFIHNDVSITGSSEFVYSSPGSSFITKNSRFYFGPETSFYYNQDGVSNNMDLILMQDKTSELFLDGCTLRTTDTGLRLTKGRLFLDNKVTLSSYKIVPQTYSNSIIFGNSSLGLDYNLDVYVLSSARLEIWGKVWHDNV